MDHEVYENEMIDAINRHGETAANEAVKLKRDPILNKDDARAVTRGLKRTLLALLTAALFAIAVLGFIVVAKVHGYLAVVIFFASVLALICSFILLYAQGITLKGTEERQGESK